MRIEEIFTRGFLEKLKETVNAEELQQEILRAVAKEIDPFGRPKNREKYYCIESDEVTYSLWDDDIMDNKRYNRGNCVTDEKIAKAMDSKFVLNNLLYRFSYQNSWTEDMWGGKPSRWFVFYNLINKKWETHRYNTDFYEPYVVVYASEEIAERAIKEIIEPFVKGHPEVMPV